MEWHTFKIVQNNGTNGKFLINCKLKNFTLELNIIQNTVAWTAEIQQDLIQKNAQELKMEPTNYLKMLKEHFNSDNVEFQFARNEFVLNVLFNQIKVKYLKCKLSKVQDIFDSVSNLLQSMYDDKNNAIKEVNTLRVETDNLRKSTLDIEHKLNEFIVRKKKEEDILYSNFILVLNEKKARIQHLTELLEVSRHGRSMANPVLETKEKVSKSSKTPKVEVKNEVSESDSENNDVDYYTDEENLRNDNKEIAENKTEHEENDDLLNMLEDNKANKPCALKNYTSSKLLEESPPTYSLPKRTKYNHKNEDLVKHQPVCNPGPSNSVITKQENNTEESWNTNNYDTQDLLDEL